MTYMYIIECTNICTYICIYIYIIYICSIYICIDLHVYVHKYMHTLDIYIFICIYIYIYIYIYIPLSLYICIYIYIYVYIYVLHTCSIYIYIYIYRLHTYLKQNETYMCMYFPFSLPASLSPFIVLCFPFPCRIRSVLLHGGGAGCRQRGQQDRCCVHCFRGRVLHVSLIALISNTIFADEYVTAAF